MKPTADPPIRMKVTNFLFYTGLVIDVLAFILAASNSFYSLPFADGMTDMGRRSLLLIPLGMLLLILAALWLKSRGHLVIATILLWLEAAPFALSLLIWGGLAVLFILFGK